MRIVQRVLVAGCVTFNVYFSISVWRLFWCEHKKNGRLCELLWVRSYSSC